MGYAFALAMFHRLGGCQTACYVHYPTITPDMLQYVSNKHRGSLKAIIKLRYYRFFAYLYAKAGSTCKLVMANSSWTQDRLDQVNYRAVKINLVVLKKQLFQNCI
jgi:alpha-1,2-mannosyltransferase